MNQHEDLEEVRELYNRYALAWDENHPADLARCFTTDAIFETQRGRFAGREAIVANMTNVNTALGTRHQRHVTANVSVHLEGERGSGTAYLIYCVGHERKLELTAFGKYEDELRKVGGRWFFSSRKAMVEGQKS